MRQAATAEQQGMFKEDKIKKLEQKIKTAHAQAKLALQDLPEYSKFLTDLAKYLNALDGVQVDAADDLALQNVCFAIGRAEKLIESMNAAKTRLLEAQTFREEIKQLDTEETPPEPEFTQTEAPVSETAAKSKLTVVEGQGNGTGSKTTKKQKRQSAKEQVPAIMGGDDAPPFPIDEDEQI